MDVFRDLYQQLIIDHNKNPRNFCKLENASHSANGYNPLCGDEITVSFIEKDIVSKLPLRGKKLLLTAGPTYEAIDPVRFIGNHSCT